ncbi:hypothetical protein [Schlesneria paludicola]|uniref:hypothetical protein n=1 Tax=Schlesneria paludicola TaxID=360056 RepID=UPI00029B1C33|nr:hypothetical protein [Schlesneria paludicola]
MFHGVWQLAKLTLESDCRRLGLHGLRFGMLATLYLAVCYFQSSTWKSASGLELFQSQLRITAFFLSMAAVFGFSQTITEEKEEDTLGLMRLADVSPLAVILGKSASLFCEAGLLIAIQFPFTIVAITLGGISWPQVIAAYMALAAYLWLLVFVSVLVSVSQPTGATAARLTAIVIGAYLLIPQLIMTFSPMWGTSLGAFIVDRISLSNRLMELTQTGFTDSPWCPAVTFGLITGSLCLGISWFVFDRFVFKDSPFGLLTRPTTSSRTSQRSWSRPICWREYEFCAGGLRWTAMRIVILFGIWLGVYLWHQAVVGVTNIGFTFAWSAIYSGFFGLLDGSWSASRLFRDEIRYQTWASLVQTPYTLSQIVFDKYCGWALGLAPTIAAPFLMIWLMILFHEGIPDLMSRVEIVIGTMSFGISVFAYLQLLVLLSLYFGWAATPISLTVYLTTTAFYLSKINFSHSIESRCLMSLFTDLAIVLLMCWFQRRILKRLNQLAEIG